jgi:hypothetical protein
MPAGRQERDLHRGATVFLTLELVVESEGAASVAS